MISKNIYTTNARSNLHTETQLTYALLTISQLTYAPIHIQHTHFLKYPPLDQVSYLLLQLKTVFYIVAMIPMKLIILVLVSLEGIGLNLSRSFYKLLILDLHEYLSDGGVER